MNGFKAFIRGFKEGYFLAYTFPFFCVIKLIDKCECTRDFNGVAIIVSTVFYALLLLAAYGLGHVVWG